MLTSVEIGVERKNNQVKDVPQNHSVVDLLLLHSTYVSVFFEVIFRRNLKEGNQDGCTIRRL
jgi:hypothetical protein